MDATIKRWLRPVLYPPLHAWQWLHDYSLRHWQDYCDRRSIHRDGTMVVSDVHGIRFVLYPFDQPNLWFLIRRHQDAAEFQAIPRLLHPGDVAIDVGANIGFYSVLLSRLCGPGGHVWSFEPVPETFWRLRETLVLNRCENVSPVQAAVSAESANVRMSVFEPRYSEWNTLSTHTNRGTRRKPIVPERVIEVPAFTLDDFCLEHRIDRLNFLKVDVEGFEVAVFRGAARMLREHRIDYICFEISQPPLRDAGVRSRDVFAALESYGYNAYQFRRDTQAFHGPVRDTSEEWLNFFASYRDLSQPASLRASHCHAEPVPAVASP